MLSPFPALLLFAALALCACGEAPPEQRRTRSSLTGADAEARVVSVDSSAADGAGVPPRAEAIAEIVGATCAEASAPSVEQTVRVRAAGYWANGGVFLEAGQTATVSATGSWTIWKDVTSPFGPSGNADLSLYSGCRKGALVARLGLEGDAAKVACIGEGATLVAEADGVVYLGMNDDATPLFHDGELAVTVRSSVGSAVPEIFAREVATTDFCGSGTTWVELATDARRVLLTVPAALAEADRAETPETLETLDLWYAAMRELAGGVVPYGGEPVRFYPDFDVASRGFMVTGNPVRFDPKMLNAVEPARGRLLHLGVDPEGRFDVARALGMAFSRARATWYQADDGQAQAWGALFAVHAGERSGVAVPLPKDPCAGFGDVAVATDAWAQLCVLLKMKERFGWETVTAALTSFAPDDALVSPEALTPALAWARVEAAFALASGAPLEVAAIFATGASSPLDGLVP
jgi:hypothetical protein